MRLCALKSSFCADAWSSLVGLRHCPDQGTSWKAVIPSLNHYIKLAGLFDPLFMNFGITGSDKEPSGGLTYLPT
jgi:hypothetical protein